MILGDTSAKVQTSPANQNTATETMRRVTADRVIQTPTTPYSIRPMIAHG